MTKVENKQFDQERALYGMQDLQVTNCKFDGPADGESALKECRHIAVHDSFFNLRYPFWHVTDGIMDACEMTALCRAALWYDDHMVICNSRLGGIKAFRECKDVTLENCEIVSTEFLWKCSKLAIKNCKMESEYPFLECKEGTIDNLTMKAKYSFQYAENITISHSNFQTKDAFWHSKNITVTDSVVAGEYLGWYSENLKLVRCHIVGTQPLCYCKGLVLEDCTMEKTDLAFERSEVNATVKGDILSVKNPLSGSILADSYGEIILEPEFVDPAGTNIAVR